MTVLRTWKETKPLCLQSDSGQASAEENPWQRPSPIIHVLKCLPTSSCSGKTDSLQSGHLLKTAI